MIKCWNNILLRNRAVFLLALRDTQFYFEKAKTTDKVEGHYAKRSHKHKERITSHSQVERRKKRQYYSCLKFYSSFLNLFFIFFYLFVIEKMSKNNVMFESSFGYKLQRKISDFKTYEKLHFNFISIKILIFQSLSLYLYTILYHNLILFVTLFIFVFVPPSFPLISVFHMGVYASRVSQMHYLHTNKDFEVMMRAHVVRK